MWNFESKDDLKRWINRRFMGGEIIKIDGKKWFEIVNIQFVLTSRMKFGFIEEPSGDDFNERRYWWLKVNDVVKILKKDLFSRRAIFTNVYKKRIMNCKCISTVHFYYRENQLNLNVYMRSCNYDKHFIFDMNTFLAMRRDVTKKLSIEKGNINIIIFSLHKEILS